MVYRYLVVRESTGWVWRKKASPVPLCMTQEEPHEWGVKMVGGARGQPLEMAPRMWRLALAKKRKVRGRWFGINCTCSTM